MQRFIDFLRELWLAVNPVALVQARERQRRLQYAQLAINMRDRHVRGKTPENPEVLRELVDFIVEETQRRGQPLPGPTRRILHELADVCPD